MIDNTIRKGDKVRRTEGSECRPCGTVEDVFEKGDYNFIVKWPNIDDTIAENPENLVKVEED